jgi:hypothetical protein
MKMKSSSISFVIKLAPEEPPRGECLGSIDDIDTSGHLRARRDLIDLRRRGDTESGYAGGEPQARAQLRDDRCDTEYGPERQEAQKVSAGRRSSFGSERVHRDAKSTPREVFVWPVGQLLPNACRWM